MSDVPPDGGGEPSSPPETDAPDPPAPTPPVVDGALAPPPVLPTPEDPPTTPPAPEPPPVDRAPVDPAPVDEDPTAVVALTEPVPLVSPPTDQPWAPAPTVTPTPPFAPPAPPTPPAYPAPPGYPSGPPPSGVPSPYAPPAYAAPAPGAFPPGVAPPPAAGGGNKGCLKAGLIVVAILVVLGVAGVVLFAVVLDDVTDDVFGTTGNAPADSYEVDLTRCSQQADGTPFSELEFTNTSGEERAFKVQVGFFDPADGGVIGAEVYDTTGSLDVDEQIGLRIEGFAEPTGEFTCRVTGVSYLGG